MKPTLDWLANPEVFAVNRKEAHSDHIFIKNVVCIELSYILCIKKIKKLLDIFLGACYTLRAV